MIFTAEVHSIVDHRGGAVYFEAGLVFPKQRAGAPVDAIDVVIETAGDETVAGDGWCGFKAVFGFVFPDERAVASVETVEVAVSGAEVNIVFVHGRLAGPTRTTPRIFVEAAADAFGFEFPNDL